jgi:regulator of nucleoside diphosphate kinase
MILQQGNPMDNKPKITMSSHDFERLEALLEGLPANAFPGKDALQDELDRADIVDPRQMPPTVVTMNSTVRFINENTREEFCMTLAYPKDVQGKPDRISILAPVGSALLGLSIGDVIEWPLPGGGTIRVRIVDIIYQPERSGEFHR